MVKLGATFMVKGVPSKMVWYLLVVASLNTLPMMLDVRASRCEKQ
jgi:hypothetical protein